MKEKLNRLDNLKPWPKGVSGNPKGRPRSRDLKEALMAAFEQTNKEGQTRLEWIIEKLFYVAANGKDTGEVKAIKELFDRAYGKPTQVMEVALEQKKPDWLNYLEAEEAKDISEESDQTENDE